MTSRPLGSVYFSKVRRGMSAAAGLASCCAVGAGAVAMTEARTIKRPRGARSFIIGPRSGEQRAELTFCIRQFPIRNPQSAVHVCNLNSAISRGIRPDAAADKRGHQTAAQLVGHVSL